MTDEHVDRYLVEAIKAREARMFCRTCGYQLDVDRYCNFCGRIRTDKRPGAAPNLPGIGAAPKEDDTK